MTCDTCHKPAPIPLPAAWVRCKTQAGEQVRCGSCKYRRARKADSETRAAAGHRLQVRGR